MARRRKSVKRNAKDFSIELFNSLEHFNSTLEGRTMREGFEPSSETGTFEFTATKSYNDAKNLMLNGDSVNAALIQREMLRINGNKHTQARPQNRRARCVVGSRPCVPAAIIGQPLSMYRTKKEQVKKPVINIFYAMTAAAGVRADAIVNAGAKLATAIRSIEAAGVRVNLYCGELAFHDDIKIAWFARVKNADKDFNLLRMAYPLINPSFLRRQGFRWTEQNRDIKEVDTWASGYGRPVYEHDMADEYIVQYEKKYGLHIDKMVLFMDAHRAETSEELAKMILS